MGTPPPIELANLGMADSLILMVMALVVFGPRRLPQIGRQIGKLMYEFRKASNDFKFQMEEELRLAEEADRRKKEEAERLKREEAERLRVAELGTTNQNALPEPVQTIEAQADVGAVEAAGVGTYPQEYPPETAGPNGEAETLTIQPPRTGELVTAAAPFSAAMEEAVSELNADAHVDANAAGIEPAAAERIESGAPGAIAEAGSAESADMEKTTPPKEPVSQHG